MVNFIQNSHKRHPTARPLGNGRAVGCLLCIQFDIYFRPVTAVMYAVSCDFGPCYNDTDCISFETKHHCVLLWSVFTVAVNMSICRESPVKRETRFSHHCYWLRPIVSTGQRNGQEKWPPPLARLTLWCGQGTKNSGDNWGCMSIKGRSLNFCGILLKLGSLVIAKAKISSTWCWNWIALV